MNDLFVVLIILFAIISFLNKIFGQKKQQPTTRRQPIPQQKPKEWIPPWFEPVETEAQIPESREEDLDIIKEIQYQKPSFDRQEPKKAIPTPLVFPEKKIVMEKIAPPSTSEVKLLKAFNIELTSQDELKRGIVLAEILGPCRARRRQQRN